MGRSDPTVTTKCIFYFFYYWWRVAETRQWPVFFTVDGSLWPYCDPCSLLLSSQWEVLLHIKINFSVMRSLSVLCEMCRCLVCQLKRLSIARCAAVSCVILRDCPLWDVTPVSHAIWRDAPLRDVTPVSYDILGDVPLRDVTPVTCAILRDAPLRDVTPVSYGILRDAPLRDVTPVSYAILRDAPLRDVTPVSYAILNVYYLLRAAARFWNAVGMVHGRLQWKHVVVFGSGNRWWHVVVVTGGGML